MAGTYQLLSIIMFILAGIFFAISCALFILLRIDKVIGDLTGMTAKKEIKKKNSQKNQSVSKQNIYNYNSKATSDIKTSDGEKTASLKEESGTTLLQVSEDENATTILNQNEEQTVLLTQEATVTYIKQSITLIHTDIVI